tara:strand:+ start:5720 stop:6127 length:408 start_codon:yes stop_codon:yes gene_type:complete
MKNNIGIKKLKNWLSKYGFSLVYGSDDYVCWDASIVCINSRNRQENKLYALIHECGHVMVDNNRDRLYESSSMVQRSYEGRRPSKQKRIAVVAEEIEAWRRGERLARKLKIDIDEPKFDKQRTMAIMSYINWAAE